MNYADIIHDSLNDCSSEEKRDAMIEAMIAFYLEMKSDMESGDQARREGALQKTQEIKDLLTARKNDICELTGLTPDQLDVASKHPMFGKEHQAVAEARNKLNNILNPESPPSKLPKNGRIQA